MDLTQLSKRSWLQGRTEYVTPRDRQKAAERQKTLDTEAAVIAAVGEGVNSCKAVSKHLGKSISYTKTMMARLAAEGRLERELVWAPGGHSSHIYWIPGKKKEK